MVGMYHEIFIQISRDITYVNHRKGSKESRGEKVKTTTRGGRVQGCVGYTKGKVTERKRLEEMSRRDPGNLDVTVNDLSRLSWGISD